MIKVREKEIEMILRDEVRKAGGKAYKWVSPGNSGVPDRIVVLPRGRVFFAELKAEGRKPTALQEAQLKFLASTGAQVSVIAGIAGLKNFFFAVGMIEAAGRIEKKYGV